MRAIPQDFDPGIVSAIDARLDAIVAQGIRIPLAIESGSRAWGFASPDSDYDCRFLFVRPPEAYLTLWAERDVIETPLDGLLDVGGWDIGKALKLIVKGNAVVIEWLRSPVIYRGNEAFVDQLTTFADAHAPVAAVRLHYRHLAERQLALAREQRAIKKAFYALRPAAALRWMRMRPGSLPPMHFPTLIESADLPSPVRVELDALLAAKARTRELGSAILPPLLAAFVEAEIAAVDDAPVIDRAEGQHEADALFRAIVQDRPS